jgi:hypothetical protein
VDQSNLITDQIQEGRNLLDNAGSPNKDGRRVQEEAQNTVLMKRKAALDSDHGGGLDLNLSLKAPNKDEFEKGWDNNGDGVVSSLSLSLSSSRTSKLGRFKAEGDCHTKNSRTRTSTLDLTL